MKVSFPTFGLEFGALAVEKSEVKVEWQILGHSFTSLVAKD